MQTVVILFSVRRGLLLPFLFRHIFFVFVVALVVGCGFRLWSVFCFVPLCSVTAILFFLRQRWSRKPEDKA